MAPDAITLGYSACPHDCPSTCALEVEILGPDRIGRVRGAADNSYTAGVICAKVARYAERIHHPDRLLKPLIRSGAKGEGTWKEASWEAALDLVVLEHGARARVALDLAQELLQGPVIAAGGAAALGAGRIVIDEILPQGLVGPKHHPVDQVRTLGSRSLQCTDNIRVHQGIILIQDADERIRPGTQTGGEHEIRQVAGMLPPSNKRGAGTWFLEQFR